MTPLTQSQRQEIEERCSKATKGPWHFQTDTAGRPVRLHADDFDTVITREQGEDYLYMTTEDEDFIAQARTDIPALLASDAAREVENERLRAALQEIKQMMLPESGMLNDEHRVNAALVVADKALHPSA